MDAGRAVSMTTEQETTVWATSLPPWWRSLASAQVCVCVCVTKLTNTKSKSNVGHIYCSHRKRRMVLSELQQSVDQ